VTGLDIERAERLEDLRHELRTPLAAIAGYAELLAARDDDATRLEAARMITQAAERLRLEIDRLIAELAE
jgi:signal transduction histidine kinase